MAHVPVLLHEAVDALNCSGDACILDCTFGRGGHSRAILNRLAAGGRVIALDRDPEAIRVAHHLQQEDARLTPVHIPFSALGEALDDLGVTAVDGVLMDLGVSSPQLDDRARGFSFQADGPLDMRMDPSSGQSAAEWIANADERTIADVLWRYGEERFSRRIAAAICAARQETPITGTLQLARIIASAQPVKDPNKHPATRAFQGIRLFINREMEEVESGLAAAIARLRPQGRLAVISFHSLEDRLVKRALRDASRPPAGDPRMPLPETASPPMLRLMGRAIKPSHAEIQGNPRARSAVLRIAERMEAG